MGPGTDAGGSRSPVPPLPARRSRHRDPVPLRRLHALEDHHQCAVGAAEAQEVEGHQHAGRRHPLAEDVQQDHGALRSRGELCHVT